MLLPFSYLIHNDPPSSKQRETRISQEMADGEWLSQFLLKLNLRGPALLSPSISKVPHKLRSSEKEAYSPLMVSIGPYHHGQSDLLPMEKHKLQCMRNLLRQVENPEETLHDCIKAMIELEPRAGSRYADKISTGTTSLWEIMLVDGCFIFDLFYRHGSRNMNDYEYPTADIGDLADPTLRHDLMLLENQIPFFILVELYKIFQRRLIISPPRSLNSLALSFFYPEEQYIRREGLSREPNHLLDLLHQSWLPIPPRPGGYPSHHDLFHQSSLPIAAGAAGSTDTRICAFDAGASELLRVGIQFESVNDHDTHLLNIRYDKQVLKIPTLSIDGTASLFMRSLISLEQYGLLTNNSSCNSFHVSSYALLLKSLIRSSADIQLLEKKKILNHVSDLEKGGSTVLAIINGVCNNIHVKRFYFAGLCKEVNTYYRSRMLTEAGRMYRVKEKLGKVRERPVNLSIYKVPNKLRNVKDEAYSPRIVSIGPFHKGKRDLLAMDEHKWRYMLEFVQRSQNSVKILEECGEAITEMEEEARGCYAENIEFNQIELVEILLLDGCFILELFLRRWLGDFVDERDPIFKNAWMVQALQHDLALLENQIPFLVLEELFKIVLPLVRRPLPSSFTALVLFFFHSDLSSDQAITRGESIPSSRHLLDLLHQFYRPTSLDIDPKGNDNWGFRHCATKLLEAGIRFEKGTTAVEGRLLDVKFGSGVITIPPLSVGPTTESLLRNLIALEQCSIDSSHHITSYAFLVNGLIRSSADIELLQNRKIIINNLSKGEEVFPIINSICKEVVLKDFHFRNLCARVNAYRKSWWQLQRHKAAWKARGKRYWAALWRDYFSNPWSIISFVAAVLLLLFTGLQTFYTVRGYYPH